MNILVINTGSSSLKAALYAFEDQLTGDPSIPAWQAQVDWGYQLGQAQVEIHPSHGSKVQHILDIPLPEPEPSSSAPPSIQLTETIPLILAFLLQPTNLGIPIHGVGHRVVHGGSTYSSSVPVTPAVAAEIERLSQFAPLHNPVNLAAIRACQQLLGKGIPQIAVFDTAFHQQMPLAAKLYPVPYSWFEQGIQRYGFHGISHRYCVERTASLMETNLDSLKLIICHLGNGASLAAITDGHSVDTTMGFTPLDGLMMGTRSGSLDPGILIHWQRQQGLGAEEWERLLNQESGLKGISGLSADMRVIEGAMAAGNARAHLAFQVYLHRLRQLLGSMLASLGGCDGLVFTAGIGEHSWRVRAAACQPFGFLGWRVDDQLNKESSQGSLPQQDRNIASPDSRIPIWVIHTQENWAIAQECRKFLLASNPSYPV
ncbi:MAG: acetate kinase [Cyanobacteriota bacterium]|nr:acetate kinase [Cyanobacteriota bacterium]